MYEDLTAFFLGYEHLCCVIMKCNAAAYILVAGTKLLVYKNVKIMRLFVFEL